MVKYTREFDWPLAGGERYRLELKHDVEQGFVEYYNVTAEIHKASNKRKDPEASGTENIGVVKATLLKRPNRSFLEQADAVSQELQELSVAFCEANGTASRVKHPKLVGDPCVNRGGFFNLDTIELKRDYQGTDLGLRIVHEILVLLKDRWSLAVIVPCSLAERHCNWPENNRAGYSDPPTVADLAAVKERDRKVTRHFARMGFVQAGRNPDLAEAWFLTSTMYFGNGQPPDRAIDRWISKAQGQDIDIYSSPDRHTPAGIDQELREFVMEIRDAPPTNATATLKADNRRRMEEFVDRGASIHNSRALFVAAGQSVQDPYSLQTLLDLGGDVNQADEYGSRPLHVAAQSMKVQNIKFLVESAGADTSVKNLNGKTPLETLQDKLQGFEDMAAAFGFSGPPREIDAIPKHDCLTALTQPSTRALLKEGWMSPRMHKAFSITADIESDMEDFGGDWDISRIDYLPIEVVENGLPGNIFAGWKGLFLAIAQVLRDNKTPTVQRVKDYIDRRRVVGVDQRAHESILAAGCRIEHAIDAVISVSKNVVKNGDDGWEYETFEEDLDALPKTPFDEAFDVAWIMCINRGGGQLKTKGPYYRRADDEDEDD